MTMKLDPWGTASIEDYSKLFEEFGISSFEAILPQIDDPHTYMKRHIIFGHRDYQPVLDAMKEGKPFSVMSGFMPSGRVHLGGKMVHYISRNPELASQYANAPIGDAAFQLGTLSSKLSTTKPNKQSSSAPDPIDTISGNAGVIKKDMSEMSMEDIYNS